MLFRSLFGVRPFIWAVQYTTLLLIRHRELLLEQIRQDLFDQHARHLIGVVWIIVHPLVLMAFYVVIFGYVFVNKIGNTVDLPLDYTSYILSGLAPWLAIQQVLNRSCTALTQSANLIKQVVFPIEILPAKVVFTMFVPLLLMLSVLILYSLASQGAFPITIMLLPLLLFLLIPWLLGFALLFSAITVFVRDFRELVTILQMVGIFMLPILYLPDNFPTLLNHAIAANPLSHIIWCFQDLLYFGELRHPVSWAITLTGGISLYAIAARIFQMLRSYYGDVL